ncbi:hypothetical protein KR018_002075, partial [Drosophila ironensis]
KARRDLNIPVKKHANTRLIIKEKPLTPETFGKSKTRTSFFERACVLNKLNDLAEKEDHCEGFYVERSDSYVDAFMAALETYMEFVIKQVIEKCKHRTGYNLYNDERCVVKNDMRATMSFLNDLEMADNGSSDEGKDFYRKRRSGDSGDGDQRGGTVQLDSVNTTALQALGGVRKRPGEGSGDPATTPVAPVNPAQRPTGLRIKYISIRDVMSFMETNDRFRRSNLLYEAYLKYKP